MSARSTAPGSGGASGTCAVGSKLCQPASGNHTCTQACASLAWISYRSLSGLNGPGTYPIASRVGTRRVLSITARAVEICSQ